MKEWILFYQNIQKEWMVGEVSEEDFNFTAGEGDKK